MKKATDNIRYFKNENGPVIGVTGREPICVDGLYFRDISGDGTPSVSDDWRKSPAERTGSL